MEQFKNRLSRQGDQAALTRMSGTAADVPVDAPEIYGGSPDALNPEEMFLASINSCLMLVFYHFADQRKVSIADYHSTAEGQVEKTKNGLRFTEVRVQASVTPVDPAQAGQIDTLARLAEKYCLVSNSVACPVHYEVRVEQPTAAGEVTRD